MKSNAKNKQGIIGRKKAGQTSKKKRNPLQDTEHLPNGFFKRKFTKERSQRSEEPSMRLVQENAIMANIGRILSSTLNIEEVYEQFAQEVTKLVPFDRIAINLTNFENNSVTVAYVSGIDVPNRRPGDTFPFAGSINEFLKKNRSTLFIQIKEEKDIQEVTSMLPNLLPHFQSGIRSLISAPLIVKDTVLGVLHLRSFTPNAYDEIDVKFVEKVGNQIAGAIANAQLFTENRRMVEALRQSEERYRTILENIEDGYYEVNLSGELTYFNDSLCRMLGYSKDEMIGMGNQQYTDEENRKKLFQAFNEVYRTGNPKKGFAWEVFKKDGTKLFGEVSVSLIKDSKGQPIGFSGIARDITDRKKAEDNLRESEEKYRTILEGMQEGYYEADLHGNIVFCNDSYCRMAGYPREQLIGMNYKQGADPENAEKLFHAFSSVYRTDESIKEFDWQVIRKDETINYFEISISLKKDPKGEPIGFWGIARDITERKQAEEKINNTISLLNATLESTADGILVVDRGGKIESFNRKFVQMWHIPEHIIGSRDDDQALAFVLNQLKSPEDFLSKVKELYSQPSAESFDLLEFQDGRVFERFSKPQWIGQQIVGRVWSFRDVTGRKKAEEALRQSEEQYRTLVEESFDGIFLQKGSDIIFANRRLHEMLGYEQGELEGRDHWIVYHPDYQALTRERALARLRGESPPPTYEVKFLRKDGSSFWGEIHAKVISFLGEPGIQVWARDITERKQAEETLRAERERFRSLSESAPFGMAIIDQAGVFKYINPKFTELFGYDLNDIPEVKTWWRKVFPDSDYRHRVISSWLIDSESSTKGQKMPKVFTAQCKDGSEKTIHFITVKLESGENLLVCENITERIQAEEALRESEGYLKNLVDSLHTGLIVIDPETHHIMDVNPYVLEITGLSKEEMVGKVCHQYICPAEIGKCPITDLKQTIDCSERVIIKANGERIPILKSVVQTIRKGRQYLIESFIDLSESKKIEKEMISLQEQLRHSQKLEAIGQLAGGIAHDFNNLLTVIKGYAELSCLRLDKSDPLFWNIEEIRKASERATNLTRQLLAFSRRQILDFKVINLNTLLKDLDKMLHRILGEDIDLTYHLLPDIGKVKTDPGQIEQVILNLAVNARDAMPFGGKLTIETLNAELDEAYARTHKEVIPGHYVMLSVSDNGTGIPPEVRERIFEPFFTTKAKGKGTGLGLSTVYGIVKQSGGNINVYSEPGLGTTFKIYLPRVEEEEDILQREDRVLSLLSGNETILLAEDEKSVRELAARFLSHKGYQVYSAADGKEALNFIRNHPERKFHLLLTDVVMPGMSGKELADRIRLSIPDIKVLFVSGYTDNAIVHHGVLEKGINFIQKPFTPEALARKVREVLDR